MPVHRSTSGAHGTTCDSWRFDLLLLLKVEGKQSRHRKIEGNKHKVDIDIDMSVNMIWLDVGVYIVAPKSLPLC